MRIRLQGPGHAAGLLSELNRCRQSRMYCDVFLQVGNRSFSAHRAVLACAGVYFRSLFSRAQSSSTTAFSLEFISPASFEKVLTFIYTGEIVTDLIDVGVLYELAERLGVSELVKACHTTFPDMQASVTTNCKAIGAGDLGLDSNMATDATAAVSVSALSVCSSAASCSSLSSSAAPTPAAAHSPLLQHRTPRDLEMNQNSASLSLHLKTEDVQSHMGYGQIAAESQLTGEHSLLAKSQPHRVLPPCPALPQLKIEMGEGEHEVGVRGICGDGDGRMAICGGMTSSLAQSSVPVPSDSCSFADPSAQHGPEVACTPTASSGDPLVCLQVGASEGGVTEGGAAEGGAVDVTQDKRLMFGEVEAGQNDEERDPLQECRVIEGTEEDEQWGQLAGEIIELSDDENYMEEEEDDDDDEDDLVCVENGNGTNSRVQVTGSAGSCKACAAPLPADPAALRTHAESHLTETGLCRVCGASFSDHTAGISHALLHVGVQLFSCDMCHLQFYSQSKLLRHRRNVAAGYTLPQGALTGASQSLGPELQCAVCSKTLAKDLQTVRDHLLSHVCAQSLSCGVCHLPQLTLCSLLWHALNHLSLAVYSCPHCAHSFLERSQLDRHMALHAEEAAVKEREQGFKAGADARCAAGEVEEMRCFLCPQTFRSSSAFQYHLSLHTTESIGNGAGLGGQGWLGKRRADQILEGSPSSSSPREAGSLVKMTNLGFGMGMGFGLSDKLLQGPVPGFPMGLLTNGSGGGLDGAAAACVREKWYRCRYCGKRFAHSGEFTYHLRIHTGEKPYQCKVCLRFFRGRSTMICHLKTHAGALMYRCTVCGLYFSTLKMVSSHMEVHKDHLPPDFNIEQTFMYNDHSKEPLPPMDT